MQKLREQQRANPVNVRVREVKLPYEPAAFAEFGEGRGEGPRVPGGHRGSAGEVRGPIRASFPEMKRFLRDGEFTGTGDAAKVTLKDVKGKAIYFTKVNDRWYVEDRKEDAAAKDEKK